MHIIIYFNNTFKQNAILHNGFQIQYFIQTLAKHFSTQLNSTGALHCHRRTLSLQRLLKRGCPRDILRISHTHSTTKTFTLLQLVFYVYESCNNNYYQYFYCCSFYFIIRPC